MRVAVLSESEADEAAVRLLAEQVLGIATTAVELRVRSRGVEAVFKSLRSVIRSLHYRTEAEGLIVVVDTDSTSLKPGAEGNRLEQLAAEAAAVRQSLGRVPGRPLLRVAIGAACPALEAWLLCKGDQRYGGLASETRVEASIKPRLKEELYGTRYPTVVLAKRCMSQAASEADVGRLEERFPIGFGALSRELRGWVSLGS